MSRSSLETIYDIYNSVCKQHLCSLEIALKPKVFKRWIEKYVLLVVLKLLMYLR